MPLCRRLPRALECWALPPGEHTVPPARPSIHKTWPDVARDAAVRFAGVALFPRLAYWLRWPTRLGPRGLLAYTAFNTALIFAVHTWLIPALRAYSEDMEQAKARLRDELGREPTGDELRDAFYIRHAPAELRDQLGRDPTIDEIRGYFRRLREEGASGQAGGR